MDPERRPILVVEVLWVFLRLSLYFVTRIPLANWPAWKGRLSRADCYRPETGFAVTLTSYGDAAKLELPKHVLGSLAFLNQSSGLCSG